MTKEKYVYAIIDYGLCSFWHAKLWKNQTKNNAHLFTLISMTHINVSRPRQDTVSQSLVRDVERAYSTEKFSFFLGF